MVAPTHTRSLLKKALVLICILHVILVPSASFCRNFPMQHFTVENGLPSNNVYSIYRDHAGYLWLATDKGVVRYNGITFEKFTTDQGLPDNDVFFFQEDAWQRLWLCCYNGELCFYKDGIFHTSANTPYLKLPFKHAFADRIQANADSSVTIIFGDIPTVVIIRDTAMQFITWKQEHLSDDYKLNAPLMMKQVSPNRYEIFWRTRTLLADADGHIVDSQEHKYPDQYEFSASQNQHYLYTTGRIAAIDETPLQYLTEPQLKLSRIYKVCRCNGLWFIATSSGLFINNDIHLLEGDKVTEVTTDIEGNYWISSLNNGIYCLPAGFLSTARHTGIYSGSIIYARALGKLLFYTTANGNLYCLENGKPRLLLDHGRQLSGSFGESFEVSSLIDNSGRYFAMEYDKCFSLSVAGGKAGPISRFKNWRWEGSIKEMLDIEDTIFVRTSYALSSCKKNDLSHDLLSGLFDIHFHRRIYSTALTSSDDILFSYIDNMCRLRHGHIDTLQQFKNIVLRSMKVSGNYIVGVSHKNELVVCHGYDSTVTVRTYSGEHCIWDKIYKLNDSDFLVSTDNQYRLLHIYPSTGNTASDVSIIENESMPPQADYICSGDSLCYFFKNGSITSIPISGLFIRHTDPSVTFTSVKTRSASYPALNGLEVRYEESRNMNISISRFSFGSRYLVVEYSVSNSNADYWRPLGNNNIDLVEPAYGHYTVKVRARTLSGQFKDPFVFTFTIGKPFWATWWFYTLCTLCLGAVLFFYIQAYRNRVARERNYLQKELSALRLQMNPHFLFNTLNSIYSLSKIGSPQTPDVVHKLSEMLRYVTYRSALALTTIAEEIEIVEAYIDLQLIRFEGRVDVRRMLHADEPQTAIVPLLLLPLVENAFKHGVGSREDRSFIRISLDVKKNMVQFRTENSIASESVRPGDYEGLGLANIRRQLSLLYKKYSLDTSANGNIFTLDLVIDLSSYEGDKLSDSGR